MIGEDDRAERSIVDHMHIIEALEARDAELAERLVRKHALDLADDVDRTPARWTETPAPGIRTPAQGPEGEEIDVTATSTAVQAEAPADREAETETISGGHLVAKALRAEGIDVIFTLCGGHIIDIYDGCIDEGIKVVDVRHEQVAAHAADGYARVTGRPGCAVVTAGPGTTDAVTGVANALRAESPMLLIGGQGALNQHRMGSLQDLPHVDIMKPITKFASSVVTTERVADMCSMAFREAFAGAPGPAYLEIGRDILDAKVPLEDAVLPQPGHYRASTKSTGDPNDIDRLADILIKAERPCVLLGSQVWTSRGAEAAHRLRPAPQHPRLHERGRPRHAAAGRSAPLPPDAPLRVQERRRDRDRRDAVRLPHGLRQAPEPGRHGRPDRHGLPHGGQEPRHRRSGSSATRARS